MQQSLSFTDRQIARRAETLLRTARNVPAGSAALEQLGELTEVLADRPRKPEVIARLTVYLESGKRMIAEVHATSTFNNFYRIYEQDGARRSTKTLARNANRNEGNPAWQPYSQWQKPGLELLAQKWQEHYRRFGDPVQRVSVRILKRRAYKHLLAASPDQIGLTQVPYRPLKRSF